MFIVHWITGWIVGWGGVGALVSLGLWVAWYLSPLAKPQLLHAAVVATAVTLTSTYVFTLGYNKGRADVVSVVEHQNKGAADAAKKGLSQVDQCYDAGGTWDYDRWRCSQ